MDRFLESDKAVDALFRFLPIRDWLSLEETSKRWKEACVKYWLRLKRLDAEELLKALKTNRKQSLTPLQLKSRCSHPKLGNLQDIWSRRLLMDRLAEYILKRAPLIKDVANITCPLEKKDWFRNTLLKMQRFKCLTALRLNHGLPRPEYLGACLIQLGPFLEVLEIFALFQRPFHEMLESSDLVSLATSFKGLKKLTHMEFQGERLLPAALEIPNPGFLRVLKFPELRLTPQWSRFLTRCSSLEQLALSFPQTPEATKVAFANLSGLSKLSLKIRACSAEGKREGIIVAIFEKLTNLEEIHLNFEEGDPDDGNVLFPLLFKTARNVQTINIGLSPFNLDLPFSRVIRSISISGKDCETQTLDPCEFWKWPNLETLNLSVCSFDTALDLGVLGKLRHFTLDSCIFDQLSTIELRDMMKNLPNCCSDIALGPNYANSVNVVTPERLEAVLKVRGGTLKRLKLLQLSMDAETFEAVLRRCPRLEYFSITSDECDDEDAVQKGLQDLVSTCSKLTSLAWNCGDDLRCFSCAHGLTA